MRQGLTACCVIAAGAIACASASPPPGGPEDPQPPKLVKVIPDSAALNVGAQTVSFFFDETINDRGSGPQEVGNFFLVSPSDGTPRVTWRRSRIDVRPRNGFRPNTAYTVTLLPGLADLRNNTMREGATVVFSTGSSMPTERITGRVFDWVAERPAARAFMQAVSPDSVVYLAQSDSAGRFVIGPLPPGTYLVRSIIDQNANRALDRNEPYDSATVVVPRTTPLELRAAQRDTLPPRILTVTTADSLTLRVTFDRLVDPTQPIAADAFRLVGPDSAVVPITSALNPRDEQQLAQTTQRAIADSVRRADSLAGKPLPPVPSPARTPAVSQGPSLPPPYTAMALKIGRRLAPSTTYRLSVSGARGLTGRSQPSERSFTTPRPAPPPADTSRAVPPADSSRAAPPARPAPATSSPPR